MLPSIPHSSKGRFKEFWADNSVQEMMNVKIKVIRIIFWENVYKLNKGSFIRYSKGYK